jgi:alpha/beta superfamily hydrolase
MTTNETAHESRSFFLEGPVGRLEAILWKPLANRQPALAAVVCHPHPLFGGTMHNKVVYQAAKSLDALGLPVLRFNFRGAGTSTGVHDRGRGEQGDVKAALDFLAEKFPGVPLLLAGFSFGGFARRLCRPACAQSDCARHARQ